MIAGRPPAKTPDAMPVFSHTRVSRASLRLLMERLGRFQGPRAPSRRGDLQRMLSKAVPVLTVGRFLDRAADLASGSSHSASSRPTMWRLRICSGSCPRQELQPPKPSRAMRRVISTTPLPIVLALTLLPAIALASPPDPSWVAGIFDGADSDDVVSLVYETCAASPATPSHRGPRPCLLEMSLDGIARTVAGGCFTRGPRSPPVVCSPKFASVFTSLPPPHSRKTLLFPTSP